jgi:hypothetical protein
MESALIIATWVAMGVVGSWLTLWFWWRDLTSLDVGDALLGAVMVILGPINLAVGTFLFACWAVKRALPKGTLNVTLAERRQ